MRPAILTLNAGSSSFRFSVFTTEGENPEVLMRGHIERMTSQPSMKVTDAGGKLISPEFYADLGDAIDHETALHKIWHFLIEHADNFRIQAVGHRVVHGGDRTEAAVVVDDAIMAELHALEPLVPLHQPSNLRTIASLRHLLPNIKQVACFDTAFHQGREAVTTQYALPRRFVDEGVRRYGFHGISYAYINRQLAAPDVNLIDKKTIVAHLGSGCSMAALHRGRSINTSMGFSALAGLPMGTRCGSLDPGVILYLMREHKMGVEAIEKILYRESGMLGMSGVSNDIRDLLNSDDPHAAEAIDFFVFRVAETIAQFASSLQGLEALVFTAGVGENNAQIRRRVCERCAWLGVTLNAEANESGHTKISASDGQVEVRVIPTDEEFMIASYTSELLNQQTQTTSRVYASNNIG